MTDTQAIDPRSTDPRLRFLEAVFRSDFWFGVQLDMLGRSGARMPPRRNEDWDFNENREADRRAIAGYAALLVNAQTTVRELIGSTGLAQDRLPGLEFEPRRNLGPLSPLDEYRDLLLEAYRNVFLEASPSHAEGILGAISGRTAAAAAKGLRFRLEDGGLLADFTKAAARWLAEAPALESLCREALEHCSGAVADVPSHELSNELVDLLGELETLSKRAVGPLSNLQLLRFRALQCAFEWPVQLPEPPGLLRSLFKRRALRPPAVLPRERLLALYCGLIGVEKPGLAGRAETKDGGG